MILGVHRIKSIVLDTSAWVFGVSMPCVPPMMSHNPLSAINDAKSLSSKPEFASTSRITSPSCFH
eukprot:13577069-Ditylum_brightwellii.AAC.1